MRWLQWFVFFTVCAGTAAARPLTSAEFEQQITSQLAAQDAEAAGWFAEANAKRDKKDHVGAIVLYKLVEWKVPGFDHAFRRHGAEELALGHTERAVELTRQALALDRSAVNRGTLAFALAKLNHDASTLDEVRRLIDDAAVQGNDDPMLQQLLAVTSATIGYAEGMHAAVKNLRRWAPDEMLTAYFAAGDHAMHGEFSDALADLDRAHAKGLDDDEYQRLRGNVLAVRPFYDAWLAPLGWAGLAWLIGLAFLLLAGGALSASTLKTARKPMREARATVGEARLRRLYAFVLWLCAAYYYVSLPLVAVAVVALGGGIVYACFAIGHVPIKLVLLALLLTAVSVWSLLKSVLVRGQDLAPGTRLDLGRHPRLRALLEEVAARVGTQVVDAVYLTPGADVAVIERGSVLGQLRGQTERCLILGVAVLRDFRLPALKAILAHEYGHLVNRDTAGGRFALAVRRAIDALGLGLARGGAAHWYNPAWLFVLGFQRLFLRISEGASRLQEMLADRWAAAAYGASAFEEGLRHVVRADHRFDAEVDGIIAQSCAHQQPVHSFYASQAVIDEVALEKRVQASFDRKSSAYDSHPPPNERIALVRAMGVTAAVESSDADAWSLIDDREKIEHDMSGVIAERLRAHRIYLVVAPLRAEAA